MHTVWRILIVLALSALLACLYPVTVWQGPDGQAVHLADDSMITLRVALNMASHGVPYFNTSEAVAANTSLFWPIIVAPLAALVGADLPFWLYHVSVVLTALAAVVAAGLVRTWWMAIPVVLGIVLSVELVKYGGSGWEHIPQMLAVTLGFAAFLMNTARKFSADALAFGALCLAFAMRPDPIVLVVGGWLIFCAAHLRSRPVATLLVSAVGLSVPVLYLGLMYHFYGEPVPNTYFLKDSGFSELEKGLVYVSSRRKSGWAPVFILIAVTLLWRASTRQRSELSRDRVIALVLLGQLAFGMLSGGDVFNGGRFYLLMLPISLALAARAGAAQGRGGALVTACFISGMTAFNVQVSWQAPLALRQTSPPSPSGIVGQMHLNALIKEKISPEDGSIGMHRLGQAFHLADYHVVDFLGKAEPHISRTPPQYGPKGHNKWDYEYVLATYDIAVAPFTMAEANLLTRDDLLPTNWMYLWVFGRTFLDTGDYELLTPEDLGLESDFWGLIVRRDLVARFR